MTTLQILALVWLALVFAVSLWQHINLGLIMIPAAFVLAEIAGVPVKSLYAGFPTKLVLLVLGVAFLWNHVQESGLADIFVTAMVRAARGRAFLLPWVMAFLTAVICAVGALPAAALAITIPVAMEIARRENIRAALMGTVVIQGACVGGFSPFNPWGNLVAMQAAQNGIALDSVFFFLCQGALALAVGLVGFFCFGGLKLLRQKGQNGQVEPAVKAGADVLPTSARAVDKALTRSGLTAYQWCSLAAVLCFITLVLRRFDVGLTAFAAGMTLQIIFRTNGKQAIAKLPWGIALMIGGVLLYVGLLEKMGVLHAIGSALSGMENPSLVRYGISLLGTIIANFESSSVAVLGLVIPVAIKSMGSAVQAIAANMQLALLSGSIAVMAASPFHIGGALILAETETADRTFKDLLLWVVCLALVLPFLAFLL